MKADDHRRQRGAIGLGSRLDVLHREQNYLRGDRGEAEVSGEKRKKVSPLTSGLSSFTSAMVVFFQLGVCS